MMYFLGLVMTFSVMAADCYQYKLKGEIILEKQGLHLVVNKDTNSQRKFLVSDELEFFLNPYLRKTITGKFILKETTIVKSEEVKLSVPDPLFRHEEMVRLSTVPCPEGKKKGAPEAPL